VDQDLLHHCRLCASIPQRYDHCLFERAVQVRAIPRYTIYDAQAVFDSAGRLALMNAATVTYFIVQASNKLFVSKEQ
jgi:hypothetical protein